MAFWKWGKTFFGQKKWQMLCVRARACVPHILAGWSLWPLVTTLSRVVKMLLPHDEVHIWMPRLWTVHTHIAYVVDTAQSSHRQPLLPPPRLSGVQLVDEVDFELLRSKPWGLSAFCFSWNWCLGHLSAPVVRHLSTMLGADRFDSLLSATTVRRARLRVADGKVGTEMFYKSRELGCVSWRVTRRCPLVRFPTKFFHWRERDENLHTLD